MRLVLMSVLAGSAFALADDSPEIDPPILPVDTPSQEASAVERPLAIPKDDTAASVAAAPRPGEESGRVDDPPGDNFFRVVGRGALFIPRAAFEIVMAPVRGTVWAYDRFAIRDRWFRLFFNEEETFGIYPTASLESTFGFTVGARVVWRDVFGDSERISGGVDVGGKYWGRFQAAIRSGDRFGRVRLKLDGEYTSRPKDPFYGIGNNDETDDEPLMPVDPFSDVAVETRYRQLLKRTSLTMDLRLVRELRLRAAGAFSDLEFGHSDHQTSIEEVYMTNDIVGFDGIRIGYGELELAWDSRGRYTRWEPSSLDAVGWQASLYAGRAAVRETPDFWRVGLDAQYNLRLGKGPRVLTARVHGETVSGDSDEVPFDELPKLGGVTRLRGYDTDRFRDRAAALGTLEYRWDLSWFLIASLFVDAGRVAPSVTDLASEGDLRVGYGLSFEGYSEHYFIARLTLASSIDGGIFLNLSFDPAYDVDTRVERR